MTDQLASPGTKIAIIGAAPSSRTLAPFDDKSWQIWACSPSNREGPHAPPRVDAWFEIHALADLRSKRWEPWAKQYIEWLNKTTATVYMQEAANELVAKAVAFPRDEINDKLGRLFLTSSIAWMLAKALYQHTIDGNTVSHIGLFGVDMSANSEYDYERPGCKYWIERARGAGIQVYVPPQSDLDAPAPQYGFDDSSPMAIKMKEHSMEMMERLDRIAAQCAECDNKKAMLLKEHNYISGALEQNNFIRKTWVSFSGPDLR